MTDSPKLEATLEQLEAERRRRIDEKIERGEAIHVPALSVVVGTPDEADGALEDACWLRIGRPAGRRPRFILKSPRS
jgi:hypothetical protein